MYSFLGKYPWARWFLKKKTTDHLYWISQYVLLPHTFIFAAFQFLLPKRKLHSQSLTPAVLKFVNLELIVYVGSYLALLNARKRNGNGHKSFGGSVSVEIWHTKESHTRSDVWRPQTMSTMTTEMPTASVSFPYFSFFFFLKVSSSCHTRKQSARSQT